MAKRICRSRCGRSIAALPRDQRGAAAVMVALTAPILAGLTALAVDSAQLYALKTQLQGAADAAVLAAIQDMPDLDKATQTAKLYATKNLKSQKQGTVLADDDVVLGYWDPDSRTFEPGGGAPNALKVTLRRAKGNNNAARTAFAGLLGFPEVDVTASAVAVAGATPTCILALRPDHRGIDLGNGTISADGCAVYVNSSHDKHASDGKNNAALSAAHICVAGNYKSAPTYSPEPETGCTPMADPLAALEPPTFGACDYKKHKVGNADAILNPAVYCDGLDLSTNGTVTLNPGVYVVTNGEFKIGGNTTVNGTGVTVYLTNKARVRMSGGATLNLSAPVSGPMTGVLFFGGRDLGSKEIHDIVGGAGIHYQGTIYFPTTKARFVGNGHAAAPSPYTMFIAYDFELTGIAGVYVAVHSDYYASAVPLPFGIAATSTRLVQ